MNDAAFFAPLTRMHADEAAYEACYEVLVDRVEGTPVERVTDAPDCTDCSWDGVVLDPDTDNYYVEGYEPCADCVADEVEAQRDPT